MRRFLGLFLILAMLAPQAARANPDVWVTWQATYLTEPGQVTGIAFEWRFDEYFSSNALEYFDADSNGSFSPEEAAQVETDAFESLSEYGYYLTVLAGEEISSVSVDDFEPTVDEGILVFRFQIGFEKPVAYLEAPMILSLRDEELFFDFDFGKGQFLQVKGPFDPACKFRVGRGEGLLEGHKKTVRLLCE